MKLKYPFSNDTRNLFLYNYKCFNCGRSDQGLELHHITGRTSSSVFNAIPLCCKCHDKVNHSRIERKKFFTLTFDYVKSQDYEANDEDCQFLKDNPYLLK